MQKKISEISQIISGYTFRSELLESSADDNILVLQSKDLVAGVDIVDLSSLKKIDSSLLRNPYFLKKGDVLLTVRGSGQNFMRAAVFDAPNSNVIASSTLVVMRLNSNEISPHYLVAYLNSTAGQAQLKKMLFGATIINSIRISALRELSVPLLDQQRQNTIVVLKQNVQMQRDLLSRKSRLLKEIADSLFDKNNLISK